ncbi:MULTISPECIES: cytidylate kinase-like family protein [Caproicibacterium]|uniref:Cytidylate kinase-like family protein n=1 Tax=Caproicibacterium argilliputei TaxID=3030016 RepID=A0AA97H1P3_9FIRM|nr:cytidylate kinase-like family protein [Caproicibacterium argilliputei]WOC32716.1 cytidylate kinase-like family protein [Caproicibacterium argilliputei]
MSNQRFVVTISHQLGCGGAYIGQKIAEEFQIPFVDRDILKRVADELHLAEADLENRDERLSSVWEKLTEQMYTAPAAGWVPQYHPSDKELFYLESEYILKIAEKTSAVILGRGGRYLLRDAPRHVRIFVTAEMPERVERVAALFHISKDAAKTKIETNDQQRIAFNRTFTKSDRLDVRLYDLAVNTSALGLDCAANLVLQSVRAKLSLKEV